MPTLLLQASLYAVAVGAVALAARAVGRRLPWPALTLAALLPVLFLAPGFFTNRTILPVADVGIFAPWSGRAPSPRHTVWLNDAITQFAPWEESARRAWKSGELPLRNRWSGSGQPLMSNHQSSAFAPWRLLGQPLPAAQAFNLEAALKLFLALTGAWLWMREISASPVGAGVGAILFAFSLAVTQWLLFPSSGPMALWPWAFFAVELSRDRACERRATILLIAVFACWPLAGHPETAALGAAFFLIWLAARALIGDLPDWRRVVIRMGIAGAAAVGLTAFLLLPGITAILASNRLELAKGSLYARWLSPWPHLPVWPHSLFSMFFPTAFGDPTGGLAAPESKGNFLEAGLAWVGSVGWALVALMARPGSRRSRPALAALAPLLAGLAVVAGAWPLAGVILNVPGFSHIFPLRYYLWVTPAAALIAAMELTRIEKDAGRRRFSIAPLLVAAGVGGMIVFTFLRYRYVWAGTRMEGLRVQALWVALVALVLFAALAVAGLRGRRVAALLLLPLGAVELFWMGSHLYRFDPAGAMFPETPAIAFLRNQPGTFRVVGAGAAMFPGTAAFAGLEEIRTHDPLERRDYVALLDEAAGYPPGQYFKMLQNLDAPLLDFLNVRYVVADPGSAAPSVRWRTAYTGADASIFESPSMLPRVFAPRQVTWIDAPAPEPAVSDALDRFGDAARDIAANADFRERAWVAGPLPAASIRPITAVDYVESVNRAAFRVDPPRREGEALLVASLLQDGGWRAHDQRGRRLETALANGPFLAIRVPADANQIRLSYAPPGFRTGVIVSLATILLLATLALVELGRTVTRPGRIADPR